MQHRHTMQLQHSTHTPYRPHYDLANEAKKLVGYATMIKRARRDGGVAKGLVAVEALQKV